MMVMVSSVEPGPGSVTVVKGLSEDGTQEVSFGVDHRIAAGLAEHVEEFGETGCYVEDWQILSQSAVTA